MKLGKGPTSVLDRHSTVNDVIVPRRYSDALKSYKTVSFRL